MAGSTKRDALIAEGLSEAEADYMVSGGSKTDGLNFDESGGYVGDIEERPAERREQQPPPPAADAQQQTPPPADDDADNPPPPTNSPFYPQWQREKRKRQDLAEQLKTRDGELTSEREKWARLDERMRLFREAMEQPEQQPPAEVKQKPDRESDPFGYMAWMEEQVEELRQSREQEKTQQQEQQAAVELTNTFRRDAATYAQTNPDFWESAGGAKDGAYHFLMRSRDAELQAAGYSDPNERMRIIALDERDIVARALHARQQNASAPGPAEVLYKLAESRGYQKRQAAPPPTPAPANGAANGNGATRAPATPSVTEQVQAIQRGQQASRSLSSAGGSPPPQGIDLGEVADMTETQYAQWLRDLSPKQRAEYRAMIGYMGR